MKIKLETPAPRWLPVGATLADAMHRAGVPILDGACIRWDAAERCLVVWTLDGRETRFI